MAEDTEDLYRRWTNFTKRSRFLIVGFWACVVLVGLFYAPKLRYSTTGRLEASIQTPASYARKQLIKLFPELDGAESEMTLIRSKDPSVLVSEGPLSDALANVGRDYQVLLVLLLVLVFW